MSFAATPDATSFRNMPAMVASPVVSGSVQRVGISAGRRLIRLAPAGHPTGDLARAQTALRRRAAQPREEVQRTNSCYEHELLCYDTRSTPRAPSACRAAASPTRCTERSTSFTHLLLRTGR